MKRARRLAEGLALLLAVFLLTGCQTRNEVPTVASETSSVFRQTEETAAPVQAGSDEGEDADMPSMKIQIGKTDYTVTLCNNETAQAFSELLPLQVNMQELNGNEKYVYLDQTLPADPESVGSIHTGDLMLFGSDCVVLFYKDFSTHCQYTRIGHVDAPDGLAQSLGNGTVSVTFQPASEP